MTEIWKDIPNYETYYQISNLGNVKSLDRYYNGRKLKGKILKLSPNKFNTPSTSKNKIFILNSLLNHLLRKHH